MATVTYAVKTRTALASTGFSTLGSSSFIATSAYTANTNKPYDVIVEVNAATTNTPADLKQVIVYIAESLDGTNFRSGPTSGSSSTDEPDLRQMGVIPINSSSINHMGTFSVRQALGYVPYAFKVVPKNSLGVALTSGTVHTSEIEQQVA
jgi:hypothetical protein